MGFSNKASNELFLLILLLMIPYLDEILEWVFVDIFALLLLTIGYVDIMDGFSVIFGRSSISSSPLSVWSFDGETFKFCLFDFVLPDSITFLEP
jgi:hypothetical protein